MDEPSAGTKPEPTNKRFEDLPIADAKKHLGTCFHAATRGEDIGVSKLG